MLQHVLSGLLPDPLDVSGLTMIHLEGEISEDLMDIGKEGQFASNDTIGLQFIDSSEKHDRIEEEYSSIHHFAANAGMMRLTKDVHLRYSGNGFDEVDGKQRKA